MRPCDTSPDAVGVGTSALSLRSERSGNGDGRVYHIAFSATSTSGSGSCTGQVGQDPFSPAATPAVTFDCSYLNGFLYQRMPPPPPDAAMTHAESSDSSCRLNTGNSICMICARVGDAAPPR